MSYRIPFLKRGWIEVELDMIGGKSTGRSGVSQYCNMQYRNMMQSYTIFNLHMHTTPCYVFISSKDFENSKNVIFLYPSRQVFKGKDAQYCGWFVRMLRRGRGSVGRILKKEILQVGWLVGMRKRGRGRYEKEVPKEWRHWCGLEFCFFFFFQRQHSQTWPWPP